MLSIFILLSTKLSIVTLVVQHKFCKDFLRVYSHQESPIVHLLWSGPNKLFI